MTRTAPRHAVPPARDRLRGVLAAALLAIAPLAVAVPPARANDAPAAGPFEHLPVPGGIAVVDLAAADGERPEARWNGRRVAVLEHEGRWRAVVGIPLGTEPGEQRVSFGGADGDARAVAFDVEERRYEEQRLVIKNKRQVNPAPLDMERIGKENARLRVVKSTHLGTLLAEGFEWPVAGPVSSPFGLRRFFNDQPRRPHGGIDIAAPEGTEIRAPAAGVVLETGDYFFNGNCVFIGHGLGLQTFYAHMSRIDVEIGERVEAGQVIGAVGATGRVTGAHLHWSVGLNATWVDPLLLTRTDAPPAAR